VPLSGKPGGRWFHIPRGLGSVPTADQSGPQPFRVSWVRLALSSLLVGLVVCRLAPVLTIPEFAVLDLWMRWRPPRQPDPRIVIIGIQEPEREAAREKRPLDCACLIVSRADLGRAIARVKSAGAAVIGVDLRLEAPCTHGQGTPAGHDRVLAEALDQRGETVLVAGASPTPGESYSFSLPRLQFVGSGERARIVASPLVGRPHGVVRWVSTIQYEASAGTEAARAAHLYVRGTQLAPLALALLSVLRGAPTALPQERSPYLVECAGQLIPVWPAEKTALLEARATDREPGSHFMMINWVGPPRSFPTFSLTNVLRADAATMRGWFAGKIVLLGSTAESWLTPFVPPGRILPFPARLSPESSMTGTEVHANALDTVLRRRFVRPVPRPAVIALIFLLAFAAAAAFQAWTEGRALVLLGGLLVALFTASYLLMRHDVWLPAVIPATAALTSAVVSALWGYARVRHTAEELATEVELRDVVTETIVHDLKQPLAVIGALASLLRSRQGRPAEATPDGFDLLEHIQQQVTRAVGDIDDLLAASPTRQIGLARQRFDLLELAREVAAVQSLKSPHHTVEVRTPLERLEVDADSRYISRALSNLVDNAIKYWPEGGAVVVALDRAGPWAEIRVVDRGLGISPEQEKRIFRRFGRAVPDGMGIPGTGIGLYSADRIVTAHGGTIAVVSEVGVGSTFIVRIPVEEGPASSPEGGKAG
jgi:signal transduction histidine kinase